MRRKSLVAAANGPFCGPWIFLEAGEWLIELPASGGFIVKIWDSFDALTEFESNLQIRVSGPTKVCVGVPNGLVNVFVHAVQLSRA